MDFKKFISNARDNGFYGNVTELCNLPVVETVNIDKKKLFSLIEDMIAHNGWICPIKVNKLEDDDYYSISQNIISVWTKTEHDEEFYTNLFHEMIHSTGAEDVLNRLGAPMTYGAQEYAIEELTSELGAAMVSQYYGLKKSIKPDSLVYVRIWEKDLTDEQINAALTNASNAAEIVINTINDMLDVMPSKDEVVNFLESLQWKRFGKNELEKTLQSFFNTKNKIEDGSSDCKDIDYSFLFTSAEEACATEHFIDIEVYYLKMRNGHVLITGTDLLDYVQ